MIKLHLCLQGTIFIVGTVYAAAKIEAHLHKHFHMAAEHGSYILGVFIILHSHFAR